MSQHMGVRRLSDAEFAENLAARSRAVAECVAQMKAETETPRSLKGVQPWWRGQITVVQHAAGQNSITVSHDGRIEGAWRLPLKYKTGPKAGQEIVRIMQTIVPFQAMPLQLGFLLIQVPGWLACKEGLCQAQRPVLSKDVEWSEDQLAAWEKVRQAYSRYCGQREDARKEVFRQRNYQARRAEERAAGRFTVTELARGIKG